MNASTNSSQFLYNKYDDIPSLELTVRNHPSSSIARFLLLKQYQKTENPNLSVFASQTSLYFNNPQWLSFQLLRNEEEETIDQLQQELPIIEKDKTEQPDDLNINEVTPENLVATIPQKDVDEKEDENAKTHDLIQSDNKIVEDKLLQGDESTVSSSQQTPINNIADSFRDDNSKVEKPLTEEAADDELIFEPLHTSDYFASQGVTIKEEALMNDKLGKQMRSFSEWLKSMKQLHPNKLPEQNDVIERIIQSSAEQSNVESEVLTEAMAEVLLKQNKQQKAIEMYEKLSLMNPSKSIYFAAKIDKIKNN
jgi:hypothetical protein